ncbi:hypothetical protein GLOTRDRAFT_131464 [Gloeophyllum trabeum ATCC 11539]|uniref:DUF6533 domain-containing protein n=1 Tax=Gloeophyllum trabeum (strain ATCC 11539 / FP-39264 / Madison 617) TaxID=670483 RepID=S7RKI8_GLOTA|nr:uncharacterized protein GLOTRDRAFT_131464 [Gloeophyllum trabeum ATCC 11539]EPQ53184.1 hypothetical protein GLOTRDRAFT_131464 [Gloeophyllum trabeum ATCC 11539]
MSGDVLLAPRAVGGPIEDVVPLSVAATGTILVYDYLCTLDDEVEYVWKSRQTLGTVLFFLNRYTPFIDTFVSLNLLTARHSREECERNFKVVLWLITLGTLISESILCLRTYALWERRRSIGMTLAIVYGLIFSAGVGVVSLEADSLVYEDPPEPGVAGCFLRHASAIVFIDYVLVLVAETIMAILTVIKAVQHLRHTRSPMVVTLYRDGILFYFMLLGKSPSRSFPPASLTPRSAITIVNVIIPVAGPPALTNWLATPQRVMHSILCTRVLLFILKSPSHQRTPPPSQPTTASTLLSSLSPASFLATVPAHWHGEACDDARVPAAEDGVEVFEMDDFGGPGRGEEGVDRERVSRLRGGGGWDP